MLKLFKTFVVLFVAVCFIFSCTNSAERTTESGAKYTLINEGTGELPANGEYLILNMLYKDNNDSVWLDTKENEIPVFIQKNDSLLNEQSGAVEAVFHEMKIGDSVQLSVKIKDLFEKTFKAPIPPNVDTAGVMTFYMGLSDALDEQGMMDWRMQMAQKQQEIQNKKAEEQLEKDDVIIREYLEENNISAQKTESGLYYIIKTEGSGTQPEAGQTVKVNYSGNVLNGPYFDTSSKELAEEKGIYNPQREPYEPIEFQLGTGAVIKGWDEGISLLKKGGKATFYIPSSMAYGPRARSAEIGPNSILIFDVELVDIL